MQHVSEHPASINDVLRPEYVDNPYPVYQRLRENGPVYWDEGANGWVVTHYNAVVAALRDPRMSAVRLDIDTSWIPEDFLETLAPPIRALTRQMLFLDPPDHTRLRGLVNKAFTPRVIEGMRPRIQQIVDELLDRVQEQGRMEVIDDFARPLPVIVIAELLGVPAQDRDRFMQWTYAFGRLLDGGAITFEGLVQSLTAVNEFMSYFRAIIQQRRNAPKDDLLQALITAEEQGQRLSEDELLGNCVLILAAGHGTTTHLIGNGTVALLRNFEQREELRVQPEIAVTAIPELLRYDSPVQITSRKAKEDMELDGKQIQAGQEVLMILGAANRDPGQFREPDRLNLRRIENRHVAFGHGIHFCLGAQLARVEAESAFTSLLTRLPNLRLEQEQIDWWPSLVFRGQDHLPVLFDKH